MSQNNNSYEALKWRFTVSFGRMLYEYVERTACERSDSINREIIKEYENQTGISARSKEDLIDAFTIKNDVEDQRAQDLMDMTLQAEKNNRGKKVWKGITFVGMPVSFVGGFVLAHKLLNK